MPTPKWRRYIRFWRSNVVADVDDELRFHFETRIQELVDRGATPESARLQALEEFGSVSGTRERLYEIDARRERTRGRALWWESVAQDVRYALRGLRSSPLFTVAVVLTLALGIGATSAMYGVMSRLLLQPPPHVANVDQVRKLYFTFSRAGAPDRTANQTSYPFLERLRSADSAFVGSAAYATGQELAVGTGSSARMAHTTMVSSSFWSVMGTRPELGRFFSDEEAHPATGSPVVVLGHSFWKRYFGGDSAALGTTVRIRGEPYTIIGVAPRGFRGVELSDVDVWLPLYAYGENARDRGSWYTFLGSSNLRFVVRLKSAAAATRATAAANQLWTIFLQEEQAQFGRTGPLAFQTHVTLAPASGALGNDMQRIPEANVSVWLVGVAIMLLIIACANVASLLLLRAMRRRREIALRLALGMGRARLIAQLFTECILLAAAGGALAFGVLIWGGAWVNRVLLPDMAWEVAQLDWTVLAVTSGCMIATAIIAGLAPLAGMPHDPGAALKDGAQQGTTRRSGVHRTLLVAQTALSVVLLIGAGLFLRSLHQIRTLDLGMDTENVLAVSVDFAGSTRTGRERIAFFERALERARTLPGVENASLAVTIPLRVSRGGGFKIPGRDSLPRGEGGSPSVNYVTPGFVKTTGMTILRGRGFTEGERGALVAVINEATEQLYWPGESALGKCILPGSAGGKCVTIIGVMKNARRFNLREAPMMMYLRPLAIDDVDDRVLLIRVAPGADRMAGNIRATLQQMEPGLPYVDVSTLASALDPQIRPWRLGATVFTAFGILAIVLAAIGLFSAVAYAVTQRTREIGVRIAVGARFHNVISLILADGLRIAAVGVITGCAIALVAGRWINDLLFDVSPRDATVFTAVAGTLLLVSALATLFPAWRAAKVDPATTLRTE